MASYFFCSKRSACSRQCLTTKGIFGAESVDNSAERRKGAATSAVSANCLMSSESVLTTISSKRCKLFARSMVCKISGLPWSKRVFFPGTPLEPALAHTVARIFGVTD